MEADGCGNQSRGASILHNNLHHCRIRLGIRDGRSLTGNREHHHLL
jgi:hypothetical protein